LERNPFIQEVLTAMSGIAAELGLAGGGNGD